MTRNDLQIDDILDRAAEQIRAARPDEAQAAAASARVWQQLAAGSGGAAGDAAAVLDIRDCADYQRLIPAHLEGRLPEARRLLLEDHTRSCVPCRRALKEARQGRATPAPARRREAAPTALGRYARWGALAAALVLGIGASYLVFDNLSPLGSTPSATIASVDGDLFRVAATSHLPLAVGEAVHEGQVVRTGRSGGAVVRLADGSLVELRERTELAIDEARRGTTLELERGSVIVQAAKQRDRHLYVATDDCLVSVTGTIFSVNQGTKGSRVSVIEGEVKVDHEGEEATLHPGDQMVTDPILAALPVAEEVAWSRDADRYLELLSELGQLERDLRNEVPWPGLRYSSRLLDLAPAGTVLYAGLPNLGATVTETHRLIRERIDASPVLQEWWESQGAEGFEGDVDAAVAKLGEVGDLLGEELVVTAQAPTHPEGEIGLVILADVRSPQGLRDFAERELARFEDASEGLLFVDDPRAPVVSLGEGHLYAWLSGSLLVASPEIDRLREVASVVDGAHNPFVGSAFYERLAETYRQGAEIFVGGDVASALDASMSEGEETLVALERSGFTDVQHLMVEQKRLGATTHHSASLTFSAARRGIASWLAAPAPMGALDFISPDAQVVTAVVFEDPVKLLDDIEAMIGDDTGFGQGLEELEREHGIDLRDDFAAVLGGEIAFAVDGPLLPTPAWKVIVEVYDPARLQWIVEQGLAEANDKLRQEGEKELTLEKTEGRGLTFYAITGAPVEAHYAFVEGYLVIAPSRALVDRAIRFRESGYSIADSERFTSLLPADTRNNFSALFFQDLGSIAEALAERIQEGELTEEQRQAVAALREGARPTLGYAYGEADRITFAAATEADVLTTLMMRLLGLENPAGIGQLLESI